MTSSIKLIDFLEKVDIDYFSGVLVFNGLTLPEAIMYDWCILNNINVSTFESGWSLNNEYALELNYGPTSQHFFNFEDRALNASENVLIDEFINNKRTQLGNINLSDKRKIISIYGNVSWDTSQTIASTVFKSMYDWLDKTKSEFDEDHFLKLYIDFKREELVNRIALRSTKMIDSGAITEVKNFIKLKIKKDHSVNKVIGIDELTQCLRNEINLDKAEQLISIKTRQYAKRQATWARSRMIDWKKINPTKISDYLKKLNKSSLKLDQ